MVSFKTLSIVIAAFLTLSIAQAQDAHPLPRHPGDIIKYEIRFDGLNADKIKNVNAGLSIRGPIPKDQAGFTGGFGTNGSVGPSSPATFKIELTVPPNIATGDYYLNFSAVATEGGANYSDGQEFSVPAVHIENPKTFTPPGVKVTPLP
jgi:hypothetical protein